MPSIKEYDISSLPNYPYVTPGEHTLEVIAKGQGYLDSNPSIAITYNKLYAVSDESVSNDTYQFTAPNDAALYDIYAYDGSGNSYILGSVK